jgi:hypothetical protein
MMAGYALACFQGRYNNKHGLYVSEDFSLTGAKPTWTLYNTGLPETQGVLNNRPITMAVDPFAPLQRQWINVDNSTIWHRDTSLGDDWFRVLNKAEAHIVSGSPEWSLGNNPTLTWITADKGLPGRLYTLYAWMNMEAAWWKESHWVEWEGGYLLASDDYGANWYVFKSFPVQKHTGLGIARRGYEVSGVTKNGISYVWASVQPPVLFGGGAVADLSATKGGRTNRMTYSLWNPPAKIDPNYPNYCYTAMWTNMFLVQADSDQMIEKYYSYFRADGFGLDGMWGGFQYYPSLPLGGGYRGNSSDHHWISPATTLNFPWGLGTYHQRYLMEDGRLYVTDSMWCFAESDPLMGAINPEPQVLFPGSNQCRNLIAGNSTDSPVFFTDKRAIYGLHNDQSIDPIRLFAPPDRSIYNDPGGASFYGLYIDPDLLDPPPGQPYVYSIDLGDEGTEDPDSSGIHQHGDNAAYDTEWQAAEHARDIKTANFTYHNPYPGLPGDAPVSDGEKYVSTPVLTLEPQVILYPADSTGVRYEFSVEGFNDAGEDAAAGDKIEVKGAGTLTGDLVLADGVEYIGSKHILIVGTVYHGVSSIFTGFTVEVTETDDDAICIIGASEGICYLYDCDISARSQSGDAFALSAERGGNIHAINCDLKAMSVSGDGYIGRSLRGKIKAVGGKVYASTDIWYVGG